jgi:hypothetical protein
VLITYHASEDTPGVDRAALGWVSHLTRRQLSNRLNAAGFHVTKWDIKRASASIRARPAAPCRSPAARRKREQRTIKPTEVGVAVMGLMRTGDAGLGPADVRGKSLVFSEPDLLSGLTGCCAGVCASSPPMPGSARRPTCADAY